MDPSQPEFWDLRYAHGRPPWDTGGVPKELRSYLNRLPASRVLIPGCGSAYEAAAFHEAGHAVIAIDFSSKAVVRARGILGAHASLVRLGDVFCADFGQSFDVIYERAFLCSLPPSARPRYAARVAELLVPGGSLAGYFYFDVREGGPPFGLKPGELDNLLAPNFAQAADVQTDGSIPIFAGKERWQEWRNR